jgi:hypothetical protein
VYRLTALLLRGEYMEKTYNKKQDFYIVMSDICEVTFPPETKCDLCGQIAPTVIKITHKKKSFSMNFCVYCVNEMLPRMAVNTMGNLLKKRIGSLFFNT